MIRSEAVAMALSSQSQIPLTWSVLLPPLVVSAAMIVLIALLREPARQKFSAIFLAGAGAAYLSGGLGLAEFAFCATMTYLAYRGLAQYRFIAIGWVLHTIWDTVHHYYGNPIIVFDPTSSIGCAICDLGLAAYYAAGAPSIYRFGTNQKASPE
jgi:hypothetical protein